MAQGPGDVLDVQAVAGMPRPGTLAIPAQEKKSIGSGDAITLLHL